MTKLTGGEMIARMLSAEGVEVAFGIVDGSYVGLNAALGQHGIRLISPRHETSAAHMAGAYARLTGRLGICIASNGPGAANILPGAAVENGEGNRVLILTSWRRSAIVNPDRGGTYQYFNQIAAFRSLAKWSGAAERFERVPEIMRRALRISHEGRPGVVHVAVPEDIINGSFDTDMPVLKPQQYRSTFPITPSAELISKAADMIERARLPMIHAGSGVLHAGAMMELCDLAERLQIPVTTSWGGRACIDERRAIAVPMNHMELVKRVRTESDLVLALGSRIGETDWWGKSPYWAPVAKQQLIQVDCDPENIGVNKAIDLGIVADAKAFLSALLAEIDARKTSPAAGRTARIASLNEEKMSGAEGALAFFSATDVEMPSFQVPVICQQTFNDDAILVIDGGNTAVWASAFHQVRTPGAHLMTYKFGMLGAGMGQALGAQVACPNRQVYCITGDGAMGFHLQEIETAVRNELPVVFVVLCDRQWGMVKFSQGMALNPKGMVERRSLSRNETINTDFEEIQFDALARSMGAHGERVAKAADLRPALERAIASKRCSVVHVDVDPVSHMWAPNLDQFKAMHLEPAG